MTQGQFINVYEYFPNLKGERSYQVQGRKKNYYKQQQKSISWKQHEREYMQFAFLCIHLYVKHLSSLPNDWP